MESIKTSPATLTVVALYLKVNRINAVVKEAHAIKIILEEMQIVAEMTDDEIASEEGLYRLGCRYVLDRDAFNQNAREEAEDYRGVYE